MALVVRPGFEADLAACAALYERVARDTFTWFESSELTDQPFWEAAPHEALYVAELDGHLAGFASVYAPDNFLHSLYVEEGARGRGVGSALFDHVCLYSGGVLSLKVQKRNPRAIYFYLKRGLVIASDGDVDWPGGGWFLMREQT